MIDEIAGKIDKLINHVLKITSGLSLQCRDQWSMLVIISLNQGNNRLNSIRVLLSKGDSDSAMILARSLFELAANLVYISKNCVDRLPQYLKHGGIPLTKDEEKQLRSKLEQAQLAQAQGFIPKQAWKSIKVMCRDLGSQWLEEFETFYRYASVPTHAGSFTLGTNYLKLLEQKPLTEHDKADILITALAFHLRIAEVAAGVFPEQIKLEIITKITRDCNNLGQTLAVTSEDNGRGLTSLSF